MKLKTFLLATMFVMIFAASAMAQDVITLKNGDDIKALVQEIGADDVKYKKFDNPNGPNYTLKQSEIFRIVYANGSIDKFVNVPQQGTDKQTTTPKNASETEPIAVFDGNYRYQTSFDNPNINPPLRETNKVTSKTLYECPKDAVVYVIEDGQYFSKVSVNGNVGYVAKGFLKKIIDY